MPEGVSKFKNITLNPYQTRFVDSMARYPALIGGVGTGKTFTAILRSVRLCELYPKNKGLIVRKDYTKLKDSTMADFMDCTGMKINSKHDVEFPNGSILMFRHASELDMLKNMNLGFFYIEQAEEFETDKEFQFLRDRLRRQGAVRYCCGFIVANANGHNWIYKLWVNSKDPSRYFLVQATTFENAHNLPKEFIEDLKHKEIEAPSHYRRYVLNDHNEQDAGDFLFDTRMLEDAVNNKLSGIEKGAVIVGLDVARFGDDRTVLCGIQYLGGLSWKQIFVRAYSGNDTMVTVGRAMDIIYEFSPVALVVDDIGVGGGVVDRLNELMGNTSGGVRIVRFLANDTKTLSESDAKRFCYKRDVAYFRLKDMIEKKTIQLLANEDLKNDLSCLRFTYRNGKKTLLSKAELKKLGYKSPDMADSLSMAVSEVFNVHKDDMFKRDKGEFSDGWRVVEPPDDSEEMGRHR